MSSQIHSYYSYSFSRNRLFPFVRFKHFSIVFTFMVTFTCLVIWLLFSRSDSNVSNMSLIFGFQDIFLFNQVSIVSCVRRDGFQSRNIFSVILKFYQGFQIFHSYICLNSRSSLSCHYQVIKFRIFQNILFQIIFSYISILLYHLINRWRSFKPLSA
jgi:hypothetical protein